MHKYLPGTEYVLLKLDTLRPCFPYIEKLVVAHESQTVTQVLPCNAVDPIAAVSLKTARLSLCILLMVFVVRTLNTITELNLLYFLEYLMENRNNSAYRDAFKLVNLSHILSNLSYLNPLVIAYPSRKGEEDLPKFQSSALRSHVCVK